MPVFFARWPDGSFSIVEAIDDSDAYVQLDEIADEPAELWQMQTCLLDFQLTGRGSFRLNEIGEDTAKEILKRAYPRLRRALSKEPCPEQAIVDCQESPFELASELAEDLRKAAKAEQKRLRSRGGSRTAAKTEIGRSIQSQMSCSGPYADAIAANAASEHLKRFKADKKKKPN